MGLAQQRCRQRVLHQRVVLAAGNTSTNKHNRISAGNVHNLVFLHGCSLVAVGEMDKQEIVSRPMKANIFQIISRRFGYNAEFLFLFFGQQNAATEVPNWLWYTVVYSSVTAIATVTQGRYLSLIHI